MFNEVVIVDNSASTVASATSNTGTASQLQQEEDEKKKISQRAFVTAKAAVGLQASPSSSTTKSASETLQFVENRSDRDDRDIETETSTMGPPPKK